jgi:hypothetical protein
MNVKALHLALVWATSLTLAGANTAPTVVIQSAAMRPGTTLMEVVYRVNDPDDATVKTRALAFIDGVRSFAKVLKPGVNDRVACTSDLSTWVELPNSRVTGSGIEVESTDPAVTAPGKFHRVEVLQL